MWNSATLTPDMASRWARPVRRSSVTIGWEYGGTSPRASERRYRGPFVVPATRLTHSPVSRRARGNRFLHRYAPAASGRKTTFAASAERAYWAPCAIADHSRGISPGFPIPRTGYRRPTARTRAGNETERSGFRMYRRTVPSRIDFVPPGKEIIEPCAAAAHPESVARDSLTIPSRITSLSMYGRTFPGETSGTLPAVREPHSVATAHASGISRKPKEASPRAARSRTPETARPAGPAASPRRNPERKARRSRYNGPCPRNGWSMGPLTARSIPACGCGLGALSACASPAHGIERNGKVRRSRRRRGGAPLPDELHSLEPRPPRRRSLVGCYSACVRAPENAARVRRVRWNAMAKRWASSRTRINRCSTGSLGGKWSGFFRPGRNTLSRKTFSPPRTRSFASERRGTSSLPAARIAAAAEESCPFPPSIRTRSGIPPKSSSWAKRRPPTSSIMAKSSWPTTPRTENFLYHFFAGFPPRNVTIDPTASVPERFEMSYPSIRAGGRGRERRAT